MRRRLLAPLVLIALAGADLACWDALADDRAGLSTGLSTALTHGDLVALFSGLAAWLLTAALSWLVVLVALALVETCPGLRNGVGRDLTSYAGCPTWLRPALLTLCGVAAVGALAGPAQARPTASTGHDPTRPTLSSTSRGSGVADGLPVPDLPAAQPVTRRTEPADTESTVVVAPGDSLWRLAEQLLPTDDARSDARTDAAWRRLYDRNRARIGAEPDLVEPGLRLIVPNQLEAPR